MVLSPPAPSKSPAIGSEGLEPSPAPTAKSVAATVATTVEASMAAPGPHCDLRSRGMGKFPPRLARGPRPQNGPHANVNLPQLPLRGLSNAQASSPIPPLNTQPYATAAATEKKGEGILTLEMRPARLHVSSLWHRLRFSGFSPMASQRRSTWKPGKPRRGRPEGTKGAGSRSL